ncbi:MAG TPA: hypothetical protein VH796_16495 [Nitrososphaeraceae archaeon]
MRRGLARYEAWDFKYIRLKRILRDTIMGGMLALVSENNQRVCCLRANEGCFTFGKTSAQSVYAETDCQSVFGLGCPSWMPICAHAW